jgi:hypothetical protein
LTAATARTRAGERGAAMTEALILIPFFAIVWGCLLFAFKTGEKRAVVDEVARNCAWERMTGACKDAPSPRCTFTDGPQLGNEGLEGAANLYQDLQTGLLNYGMDLREMFGPFFRPTFACARGGRVSKPRVIGGGDLGVRGSFSAMCNEIPAYQKPKKQQYNHHDLFPDAWCTRTGWC